MVPLSSPYLIVIVWVNFRHLINGKQAKQACLLNPTHLINQVQIAFEEYGKLAHIFRQIKFKGGFLHGDEGKLQKLLENKSGQWYET